MSNRKWQARLAAAGVVVVAGIGPAVLIAGCSDAASTTTADVGSYCAQLERIGEEFGDPGIDAIFENNPEPTLAEWAAFLPGPIERMRRFTDKLAATDPPEPVADAVAVAVKRLRAVVELFEGSQQAAADGDQQAFDHATDRRPQLTEKMEESFAKVEKVCKSEGDGGE